MKSAGSVWIRPVFCGAAAASVFTILKKGTNIRPTSVVYDRAYSAIAMAEAEEFDWEKLLDGVDLFYFSGITPAISCEIEKTLRALYALQREKNSGGM